jgi:hypothetical protein
MIWDWMFSLKNAGDPGYPPGDFHNLSSDGSLPIAIDTRPELALADMCDGRVVGSVEEW